MYFPDDPLFFQDPMWNSVARSRPEGRAADGLRASTTSATEEQWALAYRWDIVLRGEAATPMEEPHA